MFFFIFFSVMAYYKILNIVPCAMQQNVLFIHSIYNILHLLTSKSHFFPPLHPPPWQPQSVLYIRVCFCFVDICSFLSHFILLFLTIFTFKIVDLFGCMGLSCSTRGLCLIMWDLLLWCRDSLVVACRLQSAWAQ